MRAEGRGRFGAGLVETIGDVAGGLIGGDGIDPGAILEYGAEYIDTLPTGLQEMAYEYIDREGLMVDDMGPGSGIDRRMAPVDDGQGGWWSQQSTPVKIGIIGGGALALYMIGKNAGWFGKTKKR